MSNVQIAVDFVNQNISRTQPGGAIVFPMFPGATKHDLQIVKQSLMSNAKIASADVNKKFVIVNIK
jgi:hypothetical protein